MLHRRAFLCVNRRVPINTLVSTDIVEAWPPLHTRSTTHTALHEENIEPASLKCTLPLRSVCAVQEATQVQAAHLYGAHVL